MMPTPVTKMVVDLAEDWEDPIKEVMIFVIIVRQAASPNIQKNDSSNKDKGISICDPLLYFKSKKKQDGTPHLPKVTVGGKETIICMKGSSKDRVCTNS